MNKQGKCLDRVILDVIIGKKESNPQGVVLKDLVSTVQGEFCDDEIPKSDTITSMITRLIKEGAVTMLASADKKSATYHDCLNMSEFLNKSDQKEVNSLIASVKIDGEEDIEDEETSD